MAEDPIPTAEKILLQLKNAGIPQRVIAQKLAIPPTAVSNLYTGQRHLKLHEANILLQMLPREPQPLKIPLIGMAGAGRWLEAIEESRETITIPAEVNAKGRFAVEIVGDSMNLVLPEGSWAVIDPDDRRLYVGKLYLLRNADGEATIKRYREGPARFEPASDNPEYVPFELGELDFSVIGRVTYAIQQF
ncbi:S24 family peptidase [Sphingomonas sp. 1P06PA]|uniref:S24 family peptidase n=1 Tax=Sphingomonas sp. 1P06PA TaxID=554121 RepID=UPI0039A6D370